MGQRAYPIRLLLDCPRCGAKQSITDVCRECGLERQEAVDRRSQEAAGDVVMSPTALSELPWQRVESSNLHSVAYADGAMFVRFSDRERLPGRVYRYPEASGVYEELLEAERDPEASVGRTFHKIVKRAELPFARVRIRDPEEV